MNPDQTPIDADESEAIEAQADTVWCDWADVGSMINTYAEAVQHLSSTDPQLDAHRSEKEELVSRLIGTLEMLDYRVRAMLQESAEDDS